MEILDNKKLIQINGGTQSEVTKKFFYALGWLIAKIPSSAGTYTMDTGRW